MYRRISLILFCLAFLGASVLLAWPVTGTLTGTVTTPAGKPVSTAAVTITNVATNASVRVLTGPDGTFTIAGLPPGTYRIEVQSAGFKRTTQQNIVLTAGAPITFNIILTP